MEGCPPREWFLRGRVSQGRLIIALRTPAQVSVASYSEGCFCPTGHCGLHVSRRESSLPPSSGTKAPSLQWLQRCPWLPTSGPQREGEGAGQGMQEGLEARPGSVGIIPTHTPLARTQLSAPLGFHGAGKHPAECRGGVAAALEGSWQCRCCPQVGCSLQAKRVRKDIVSCRKCICKV